MTAQNRSRAGFACSVALLFLGSVGCASTSTRSDRATVRDVVAKHGGLQFDARDPGSEPRHTATQETRRLLARPLSADDAVRIAFLENRDLRAQLADLGVARADLVRLTTLPNPEGHAAVRMSRDPNQDPQWDFGVAMNLTRLILVGKADSVGTNRLEAARMRTAGAALTLAYRVRLAYYALQAAQGKLALLRANVDAARASVETATELHRVGNLPALDLSQQEAAFAEARVELSEAEAGVVDAHEMLGILLGVPNGDATWTVEASLSDPADNVPSLEETLRTAMRSSLEMREAEAEARAAADAAGLSELSGWLPDLSVGFHMEFDGDYWETGPEIMGSLPVFDRNQGDVLEHESELEAARARYVAAATRVRAVVRAVRNRAVSVDARAREYRDAILPIRKRVLTETIRQYNAMQLSVFQALDARRQQIRVEMAYLDTLREYWDTRAALDLAIAGRPTDVELRGATMTTPLGGSPDGQTTIH